MIADNPSLVHSTFNCSPIEVSGTTITVVEPAVKHGLLRKMCIFNESVTVLSIAIPGGKKRLKRSMGRLFP